MLAAQPGPAPSPGVPVAPAVPNTGRSGAAPASVAQPLAPPGAQPATPPGAVSPAAPGAQPGAPPGTQPPAPGAQPSNPPGAQSPAAPGAPGAQSAAPAAPATTDPASTSAAPPEAPAEPPPYQRWSAPPAPPPTDPRRVPPPLPPPPQYARRTVELIPHLGVGLPHCHGGSTNSDRCSGVGGGLDLGFTGLWRVSPYFAWGGALHLVPFSHDPENETVEDPRAFAAFLGLIVRVYFMDEGRLDPYAQLGLGGGALGTSYTERRPSGTDLDVEESGAGPAVQIGGGLDVIITRSLRIGPTISYTRVFVDKIRRCTGGANDDCMDIDKGEYGYLDAFTTLGARLTIMVGDVL